MKRLAIVVVVVAGFGALFAFGLRNPVDRDIPTNRVGKTMPDFEMPLFERYAEEYGPTFKVSENLGKPMVINFWASWCPPCQYEAPVLEAGWQEYGNEVLFVGVDTQDSGNEADARAFIENHGLTFPNGKDESSRIGIDYGLFGLPETFFIRADGTLLSKHSGAVTQAVLDEQVGALLR